MKTHPNKPKLEKRQYQFNAAYEATFGKPWDWKAKDENGELIHPLTCGDPVVTAFYKGFRAASVNAQEIRGLWKEIQSIEEKLRKIKELL